MYEFNSYKINQIDKAKKLVGKLVRIKGDDTIYQVKSYLNTGHSILSNDAIQDPSLLIVVKIKESGDL